MNKMKKSAFLLSIPCFTAAAYSTSGIISPIHTHTTPLFGRKRVLLYKKPPKNVATEDSFVDSALFRGEVPANLKRKVEARRPALGHIVPKDIRRAQRGGTSNPRLRPQGKAREAGLNNPSNLKILGGSAKGKRLDSPDVFLRPMMGKVREAVFSSLTSFGLYNPETVTRHLDVFSGSGSVGIESLSRGAKSCTFVDLSSSCCDAIKRNLAWCNFDARGDGTGETDDLEHFTSTNKVVCSDALQAFRNPGSVGIRGTFQIVTACPPYEEIVYADLLHAVANSELVEEDTIILLEYPVELGCLPHAYPREAGGALVGIRNRRYGRTVIAMYIVNPTGRLELATSRPEEFVSL